MKIEQTKRDIEYTIVLTEDEANLLTSILGNQWTDNKGSVQRMFDALCAAGTKYDQWQKRGGDGWNSGEWVKR